MAKDKDWGWEDDLAPHEVAKRAIESGCVKITLEAQIDGGDKARACLRDIIENASQIYQFFARRLTGKGKRKVGMRLKLSYGYDHDEVSLESQERFL